MLDVILIAASVGFFALLAAYLIYALVRPERF
jgi:K+-transporting ATPase KdpF subunit